MMRQLAKGSTTNTARKLTGADKEARSSDAWCVENYETSEMLYKYYDAIAEDAIYQCKVFQLVYISSDKQDHYGKKN